MPDLTVYLMLSQAKIEEIIRYPDDSDHFGF